MFKKDELKNFVRLKVLASKVADTIPQSGRSSTGYGNNLPTQTLVQTEADGPWRRLRAVCQSNAATSFVWIKGERVIVED